MKRLTFALLAAAALGFAASPAEAQSAKFAASYDTDAVIVDTGLITIGNKTVTGAEVDLATIHVASQKDLLIGVSAQIGIYTLTEARSREGNTSTAIAEGNVAATVVYAPTGTADICANGTAAAPGEVTFAARLQELSVTNDAENEVVVRLVLDTTAAHHFNYLGIDLAQGTYDVAACFDLRAFAEVIGDGEARAKVALGKRVVAVQEVRAAKGGIVDESGTFQEP